MILCEPRNIDYKYGIGVAALLCGRCRQFRCCVITEHRNVLDNVIVPYVKFHLANIRVYHRRHGTYYTTYFQNGSGIWFYSFGEAFRRMRGVACNYLLADQHVYDTLGNEIYIHTRGYVDPDNLLALTQTVDTIKIQQVDIIKI